MKLPNIKGFVQIGKAAVAARRPEILFGTSVVSTVGAVVLAARGGYKSGQEVMREEYAIPEAAKKVKDLSTKEKFDLTWVNYLPAAGAGVVSLGSTTGLHIVHVKEKKALAATAMAAIEEIRTQAAEFEKEHTVGVMSNEEKQKVLEERAEKTPIGEGNNSHIQDSSGFLEELYLVRDGKTGRDIWSNQRRIEEAVQNINDFIQKHGDCDLNSFYSNAGFELLPDGDDWGWSGDFVELAWDEVKRDDGRPVRRFKFRRAPEMGYDGAQP